MSREEKAEGTEAESVAQSLWDSKSRRGPELGDINWSHPRGGAALLVVWEGMRAIRSESGNTICPDIHRYTRPRGSVQSFLPLCTAVASRQLLSLVLHIHDCNLLHNLQADISKPHFIDVHTKPQRAYEIASEVTQPVLLVKNGAGTNTVLSMCQTPI